MLVRLPKDLQLQWNVGSRSSYLMTQLEFIPHVVRYRNSLDFNWYSLKNYYNAHHQKVFVLVTTLYVLKESRCSIQNMFSISNTEHKHRFVLFSSFLTDIYHVGNHKIIGTRHLPERLLRLELLLSNLSCLFLFLWKIRTLRKSEIVLRAIALFPRTQCRAFFIAPRWECRQGDWQQWASAQQPQLNVRGSYTASLTS